MSNTVSLAEIEAKARAGDARAQYLLSALYSSRGNTQQAKDWLQRSYEAGYPDALYTVATGYLKGVDGAPDIARAVDQLNLAMTKGSNAARRVLATLHAMGLGCPQDWNAATAALIMAAQLGDGAALRQLGLLVEIASPQHELAAKLLYLAALAGDGLAAFALARRQAASPRYSNGEFGSWVEILRRRGHPLAQKLSLPPPASNQCDLPKAASDEDWRAAKNLLADPPVGILPLARQLSARPAVWTIEGLFREEECDYVVGLAAPLCKPSKVHDPVTGAPVASVRRTSGTATISPVDSDLVLYCLGLRVAAAAQLPVNNAEMLSVLRYAPGEEYKSHVDYIAPSAETAEDLRANGQRIKTALVYLNEDYRGGETFFLSAGLKLKGKMGDGAVFSNVDEAGRPDTSTVHAGLPVTQGVKWLASTWFRAHVVDLANFRPMTSH